MLRTLFVFVLMVFTISVCAQGERVFMQTDKKICFSADTIWFRSFILTDSFRAGSNFYLELFDKQSVMLERKVFPINGRDCSGQIGAPVRPGCYWLRGYTLNGATEAIIPINVLEQKAVNVVLKQSLPEPSTDAGTNLVTIAKHQQQYTVNIASQQDFSYCISVTATDDVGAAAMPTFPMPAFPKRWDTTGLVFRAHLVAPSDKRNSNLDVHMYVQYDTLNSLKTYLSLDSGLVTFQDLYFYGPGHLHYQLFKKEKPVKDNYRLGLLRDSFPAFNPPLSGMIKDTLRLSVKMPEKSIEEKLLLGNRFKTLKTVEVKAKWKDRHLALNNKYVVKDEFKGIEHFTFDLRNPINPGKLYFVLDYLASELPPNWRSGNLGSCKGVEIYVDESLVSIEYAATLPLADFAYAKVFQDLHPPCPAICLYKRHSDDAISTEPPSKTLEINGYTPSVTWSQADPITWFWNNDVRTPDFHFPAPSKPFRIVITGRFKNGDPILYEKTVTGDLGK